VKIETLFHFIPSSAIKLKYSQVDLSAGIDVRNILTLRFTLNKPPECRGVGYGETKFIVPMFSREFRHTNSFA
jgi:hypothetical protein